MATLAPTDAAYSYAAYTAAGYDEIPSAKWEKYRAKAWRVLKQVTQGRLESATIALEVAKIPDALFEVATALYVNLEDAGNISSEKIGTYAVTYKDKAMQDPAAVALSALSGTSLTYCGLSIPAFCLYRNEWDD